MQGSRAESIEAWTKRQDEQNSEDSQQYSSKFEKGYRVFQMSSERNQANLQIQKLTIQLQGQRRENRKAFERVMKERDDLAVKCEYLNGQLNKATTMLQAEETARKKINSLSKAFQNEVKGVREALGGLDSWEAVLAEILKMKKRIASGEETIQGLSQSLLDIRSQKDKEIKSLKQESQLAMKQVNAAHKDSITEYEGQLNNLRSRKNQADILERQAKDLRNKLSEVEEDLFERDKLVKNLTIQITGKDEQLKGLRIKQEIWKITQQKSREERARFDEEIQQLRLKLELSKKKIEQKQQKISEIRQKATHAETVAQEKTVLLCKRQEEQIILQEELELFKKKVHHGEIYKQKYCKIQAKMRQHEERAAHFESIAQQYAQQIHELEQALQTAHVSLQENQQEIASIQQQNNIKQRQITALIQKVTLQSEVIKQKSKEIAKVVEKLQESDKKVAFLTYSRQSERLSPSLATQHILQETREKISSHYEKILRDEEIIRKNLQVQVSETRKKMFELRIVLSRNQQQLAELRQEKQLAQHENKKMSSVNSQRQRLHEKKIVQLRDRYRQMSRVKSQTYFRGARTMRIISCYSYSLFNQKEKTEYNSSFQRMHDGMDSTVRRISSPSRSDTYGQQWKY